MSEKYKKDDLEKVAIELNAICSLDPLIDIGDKTTIKILKDDIKDVFENTLEKDDILSQETETLLFAMELIRPGKNYETCEIESEPKGKQKIKDILIEKQDPDIVPKKKKIGIIATIIKCIESGPINKAGILEVLIKNFPERKKESMKKTINVQVPNRIKKEKNDSIFKDENDNWNFAKNK